MYTKLNADIMLSRAYTNKENIIWMDIINIKVGESYHKQQVCVEGQGWTIVKESVVRIGVGDSTYNPYIYANRLDIEKEGNRQVMVDWFMFKKFGSGNAVTMIRLSSPVSSDYFQTFSTMERFIEAQLFTTIYENVGEPPPLIEQMLYGNRITSPVIHSIAVMIPMILIFNRPIVRFIKRK